MAEEWQYTLNRLPVAINIGRTLQEPVIRLQLRDKLLDLFDVIIEVAEELLNRAAEHTETLMQAQSHMSAAQPTTFAAYLIAVCDGLLRGNELLAVAYDHTNKSSAGCGASSCFVTIGRTKSG